MTWENAQADALEARAETIDESIVALTRLEGMYDVLSERRSALTSLANRLQDDVDDLRREAQTLRKASDRREGVNV